MKLSISHLCRIASTVCIGSFLISCGKPEKPGPPNFALQFDGVDDYVEIPDANDALDTGTNLTMEVWFKTENSEPRQMLVTHGFDRAGGKNNGLKIHDGKLHFVVRGHKKFEDLVSTSVIAPDTWNHAAFTFDGSTGRLYLNGELEAEVETLLDLNTNSRVQLGRYQNPQDRRNFSQFKGLLDDVRIWNIARSQQQIKTAMNAPLTGAQSGLVAYWNCDEGTGDVLSDQEGGNPGILGDSPEKDASDPVWIETSFPNR